MKLQPNARTTPYARQQIVGRACERVLLHVLHQMRSYAAWTAESFGRPAGPFAKGITGETVRQSPAYRVCTPEDAVALAESLAPHSVLSLNPLLAGIDPKSSWDMLRLYEREVHPHVQRLAQARG